MKKNSMRTISIILAMVFTILLGVLGDTQSFAADKVADHDITYWVKNALRHDARIGASEITVRSQEGIVTLSGKVKNLAAKRYASLEAKKINGVLSVINKIEVKPSYRRDMDITHDVRRRILNSAVIESQGIREILRSLTSPRRGKITARRGTSGSSFCESQVNSRGIPHDPPTEPPRAALVTEGAGTVQPPVS